MYIDIDISNMDLTGSDPEYRRIIIPFTIYKANQTIDLSEPLYKNSLLVQTKSGSTYSTYSSYTIGASDDTATAKAKYAKSQQGGGTFTSDIVRTITVTGYTGTTFTVYVTYQALYRDTTVLTGDEVGPSYTPGLMRAVLNRLSYLTELIPPLPNVSEETVNTIQVLAEDLAGNKPENYIHDEIHLQVNTLANRFIVRPANGSFYKQDLVVKHNNITLVENIDYEVTGINLGKTRVSTNTSGVYDYIMITRVISAGVVTIDYRAFGGAICPVTIDQIKLTLANLIEYIKLGGFLTSDSLQSHPIIVNIIDRIINIENMLHIQAPITYTYTATAADKWCNIAQIKPNGTTGLVATLGNGQLRVRCGKYFAEVKLNYDLLATRQLDTAVLSAWSSSFEDDGVDYYTNRICPKFRMIWNSNSINSGIILQMSMTTKTAKTLSVEIQNSGGLFSDWELYPSDGNVLPDKSSSATLPSGVTWTSGSGSSKESNILVVCGKSYTIFTGTVPMSITDRYTYTSNMLDDPQDNSNPIQNKHSGLDVPTDVTGTDVLIPEVAAMAFKVYDRHTGTTITKISDYIDVTNSTVKASGMYFVPDLCCVECELTKSGNSYHLSIGSSTGTNSLDNNRFDFKQVDVIFKGVATHD